MFEFLEDFDFTQIPAIMAGLSCYFLQFAMIVFGIMIVIAGIMFVLSRGNPEAYSKAKKTLVYTIIGGLLIYGVYTIILSLALLVGVDDLPWIPLSCS